MRFRFTVFLIVVNLALFLAIWKLESGGEPTLKLAREGIDITRLEIDGKNFASPRIVEIQNNKWRILSPIKWAANSFSVNRIRNQLEFLDKETSFPLSEISRYGHTLADYGLDSPAFVVKYGNDKTMRTLKIGANAPVGNRVYMLDEDGSRIFVVDRQFADNFSVDMDHLRDQSVFTISNFEIGAFSIILPQESGGASGIRRLGLRKDGGIWKIETPVVAAADQREVDSFLNNLCSIQAKSFSSSHTDIGFELASLSASITLEGTNRRDELRLGKLTDDGSQIYAKLDGNPTVFTLDSSLFKNLGSLQTTLRDKSFVGVDADNTTGLDILKDGLLIKLRKLKGEAAGGIWDAVETLPDGKTVTAMADISVVQDILRKLERVKARDFVANSATDAELDKFGLTGKSAVKISDIRADANARTLVIGAPYRYGGATLRYAMLDGEPHIYGISEELVSSLGNDFLFYRSRRLEAAPEKSEVSSLKILEGKSVIFDASPENGDWNSELAKLPARKAAALKILLASVKVFNVREYVRQDFSKVGVKLSDKEIGDWEYSLEATYGDGEQSVAKKWLFSKRLSGSVQYGASESANIVFIPTQPFINAFAELTAEMRTPKFVEHARPISPEEDEKSDISDSDKTK